MGLGLYEGVSKHNFSEGTCFLCGKEVDGEQKSREHIFPGWLLNHFGLWDRSMHLLNGSTIPYRMLCIPCCKTCNNEHLSDIEKEVQERFLKGSGALAEMERSRLMLWVLKIFFGLLYREIFLPFDRKQPELGKIVTPEMMEQYQMLHYLLQSSRIPMRFFCTDSDIPASIYVFQLKEPANPRLRFDFKDDVIHRTLYLRMGNVGILAAFDMGAQTFEGRNFFPQYQRHPLHPIQFEELGAYFFLKARMLNRNPKLILSESPSGINFTVMPLAGFSGMPVFNTWDVEELADMLTYFMSYPKEAVMPVEGQVATWLRNEDGSLWNMDIAQPPWSLIDN